MRVKSRISAESWLKRIELAGSDEGVRAIAGGGLVVVRGGELVAIAGDGLVVDEFGGDRR